MNSTQLNPDSLPVFRISLEDRMRAAAGIPAYMRRKRRIEDMEDAIRRKLLQVFEQALHDNSGDQAVARATMMHHAQRIDLRSLNDLIDRHNRYYPVEANLPTDVKTGHLMAAGKPWEPLAPLTWTDICNI